jgi:TIR domain/RAMP superfamily
MPKHWCEDGVSSCDGKGWNCPQPHRCPSCSIFGFSNYHHGGGSSSLVRFSSASLFAIPVRGLEGIVWFTSWFRLSRSGLVPGVQGDFGRWAVAEGLTDGHLSSLIELLPPDRRPAGTDAARLETGCRPVPPDAREAFSHLAVVDESALASLVVHATDSTTSVSLDPATGRARPGALFEVEHINRWSLLSFEATYLNPAVRGVREFLNSKNPALGNVPATVDAVIHIVESALGKIRFFGIGGKRSRGYGRVVVWPLPPEERSAALDSSLPVPAQSITTRVPRVMISYSHTDKNAARRLAADLQERGLDVWLDEREVLVGDSIHAKVAEGISGCDYLVALLSSVSLQSEWVREEINAVRMREKESKTVALLPVVLAGVEAAALPATLKDRRVVFLARYDEALQELIRSIQGHEARRRKRGA